MLLAGCGFHSHSGIGDAHEPDALLIDAAPGDTELPPDAALDAAAPTCSTAGLSCPGGQAVLIAGCGDACWVGCTNGTPITEPQARANCVTWGGTLGAFASATELACVRAAISPGSAMWIGLEQAPGAATPQGGWSWISGDALGFTAWAAGQPNDGDGGEADHAEQCAYSSTQTTWQDASCSDAFARFACRASRNM